MNGLHPERRLRRASQSLIGLALTIALSLACTRPAPARVSAEGLSLGLYEVVQRTCQAPPEVVTDCDRIQYVELIQGTFFGVENDQTALVFWLAVDRDSTDYTYNARRLRGQKKDVHEYVIDEGPTYRESLTLQSGAPAAYAFAKYVDQSRSTIVQRTELSLKPVARNPDLAKRLEYPEPVDP